ncbi:UV DNA damage repair endonuclease UvsE [Paenibacillus sp. KQZ6P-2]|uniref:UV DNA damage repair endonuclease UvsE n=1 Tax=Paenibacillus mangrovi TaxID=2931978 RepID=A0A9X1WQB9_9BACL|nr:UV DNA damage repair endonuclease UvsE [Paenibacillus mangrovi]MCJ8011743.1 UV DNA damage repair endonuclease UvsE [Paenibacillus mangrovi]
MIVRFGYVAMSVFIKDSSPSKTMTMATFSKLSDREAAIRKLERIGEENLHNTLRLLKHNNGHDIRVYRFSSKLIPLATHEDLQDWDPFAALKDAFAEVGAYVRDHEMRVSFHPDHFTVLSTPRQEVLQSSIRVLRHHVKMLKAMGLDATAKNNIHIGGAYKDKPSAAARFKEHFAGLDRDIQERLTLENDDKTFTAVETLQVCKATGLPMVLDLHHQWVNNDGEKPWELWPDILQTWNGALAQADANPNKPLPPKIHISSPKSESDPRSHADLVDPGPLLAFLREIAGSTPAIDVMIEAKSKDDALFHLMKDLASYIADGIKILNGASIEISS